MGSEQSIRRIGGNPRMSMAVVHGGAVTLAGQVAIDAARASKGVSEQTEEVLARIDALLAEAGSDKRRLIACNLYVADIATLPAINAVWDRWVAPGEAPARTTIETRLASPAYALEIGAIAALG